MKLPRGIFASIDPREVRVKIRELDTVVLTHNIPERRLKEGDAGAVVHCYADGEARETEFATAEGVPVAALTLGAPDVQAMESRQILHAREFAWT